MGIFTPNPADRMRDQPTRPEYTPAYDPAMDMTPEVQKLLDAISMDPRGLEAFRKEALRKGPSAWAGLMNKRQAIEEMQARDYGAKAVRGSNAQARNQLAMRGGLTSGARERVARQGARDFLDMGQQIGQQAGLNRLQIGINDEQNRIQQLSMLPGMEVQALQPQFQKTEIWGKARQYDNEAKVREQQARNAWGMDQYKEQMAAWAANRQAEATENSGK